jgi:hypothetical protein
MGFIATLYSRILFSRFRCDFLHNNQSNFFVITSICFLLVTMCSFQLSFLSNCIHYYYVMRTYSPHYIILYMGHLAIGLLPSLTHNNRECSLYMSSWESATLAWTRNFPCSVEEDGPGLCAPQHLLNHVPTSTHVLTDLLILSYVYLFFFQQKLYMMSHNYYSDQIKEA